MEILELSWLGNSLREWLLAALTAVVLLGALWVTKRILLARIVALSERTEIQVDDLLAGILKNTNFLLMALLAFYVGSLVLEFPENVKYWISRIALFTILVQVAIWGDALITFFIQRYQERHLKESADRVTTLRAISFVVRLVLFSIILLLALDNMGIEIGTLIASLGVGSIAVALAVQSILADLFASLSIAFDQPFVIGDFIIVEEHVGTVEKIGLKTTRVRSLSGEQLVFSNNDLLNSRIRNYKRMGERRVMFTFGVIYQTPIDQLESIPGWVSEIVQSQEHTRFDRAHFKSLGDFSLDFEVVYYVQSPEYSLYMDIQQAINLALMKRFEQEGVEFAYPTQTLFVSREA
jgi:small-conductance mechanosensitive channel